ncbi:sulfite exporter TauE/SafE family protein [Bradyrhizobium sp. NAS96.2]|uniref:sulfite exporter TauE/SafE family protein n=1 Tax=Bradyrhizobium sp. NAS96.2 TaxID=1680160 RepID=UPI0024C0012A|nr:sulfite exporter TauE/SafE family protein [Bradyrhizobium sp. NAS96.2]
MDLVLSLVSRPSPDHAINITRHLVDRPGLTVVLDRRPGRGTAFFAVMAFAGLSAEQMRPTALVLNVVAASYATWRLHRHKKIEWNLLWQISIPSMLTAFIGGLLAIGGSLYSIMTGTLLIAASFLMLLKRRVGNVKHGQVPPGRAALVGAATGLLSGFTGIGGGVFLVPLILMLGWVSPRQAAGLSPPFILCNSVLALAGVLLSGQSVNPDIAFYIFGAVLGAMLGTCIGLRWMNDWATRYVLATILFFARQAVGIAVR